MKKEREIRKEIIFDTVMATINVIINIAFGVILFIWHKIFIVSDIIITNSMLLKAIFTGFVIISFCFYMIPSMVVDNIKAIKKNLEA